uniref:Cytochrome c6 n=1 Tax=Schizocladia ischiensis TaxID=196139 RepID=A0A7S6ZP97_9STRA|nr:PetJ [Schizocladia ischiensis]QOW07487.1 PetJ [Schizocladia ischiensis]
MKKSFFSIFVFLLTITNFSFQAHAAGDVGKGKTIFDANCAACHDGGNNVIMPEKNLKKDTLAQNEMNSSSAITYQVTNGKNAMPAFGGRLSDEDITNVASFVLSQSEQGWD